MSEQKNNAMKLYYTSFNAVKVALLFFVFSGNLQAQTYINPLPIPYVIDNDTIELRVDTLYHNFNPNGTDSLNTLVRTFAYNHIDSTSNTFLGPVIVWKHGTNVHTTVKNNLSTLITVHWHGAHVPARADGNPQEPIQSDSTWKIDFPILDEPATMWYHPHVHGHSFEQVEMGMAGLIYVEDQSDTMYAKLPHSYGVDDFPIIIQERIFKKVNNELIIDTLGHNGNVTIINGVKLPYLHVPAQIVRFRILNGSSKFAYYIGIGNELQQSESFTLIATDAGLTEQPFKLDSILMGAGVRTEWLLDLNNRQGDTLYLMNYARSIPDNTIGSTNLAGSSSSTFMRIIVDAPSQNPIISIPATFPPLAIPDTNMTTKRRTKTFYGNYSPGNSTPFTIDHTPFNMTFVNDTVLLGATEIWTIHNRTNLSHPFHIHDIHFFILDIWDSITGNYIDMPNEFKGPKDNVLVRPGWKLRFVTKFMDWATPIASMNSYMYHCHILPHEDKGMMGQFVVWDGVSSIGSQEIGIDMVLFPNPAGNALYLKGKISEASKVQILDINGRILKEQSLSPFDGVINLDIKGLPSGIILVAWQTSHGNSVKKVIIN